MDGPDGIRALEAAMRLRADDGREYDVELTAQDGARIEVRIDGRDLTAEVSGQPDGGVLIDIGGRRRRAHAVRRKGATLVAVGNATYEFAEVDENAARRRHGLATPEVTAPMPGKVLKVLVREGAIVNAGDGLLVLEAMKMETTLAAESAALVKRVLVAEGDMVDHGARLIELSPVPSEHESGTPKL
ncbi:MAG: biotin/lipoyl-containing protein [Candidatus Binataceae bacterium]